MTWIMLAKVLGSLAAWAVGAAFVGAAIYLMSRRALEFVPLLIMALGYAAVAAFLMHILWGG